MSWVNYDLSEERDEAFFSMPLTILPLLFLCHDQIHFQFGIAKTYPLN